MRYLSMIRTDERSGKTPSEKLMNDMGVLIDEMMREGKLIATGGLRPSAEGFRMRNRHGDLSVTDGPFTEAKEVIGGYAILEAGTKDEALELVRRFLEVHGEDWDITCEVRPLDGPEFRADGAG